MPGVPSSRFLRTPISSAVRLLYGEESETDLLHFAAVAEYGASAGDDPFVKIKGLIFDSAAKLEIGFDL